VGGTVPGVALEQAWRRVQQEGQQQTVRLGQVQRALQSTVGGTGVAERIPGNRLQHVRQRAPVWPEKRSRAVQDREGFQYLVIGSDLYRYDWAGDRHAARSYS
jgi:hypothetical protein